MVPRNGSSQLPDMSMIKPPTTGLMMAASAEPVFIMPLAVPDNSWAMSIGTAHIGPITISAKKNPAERQITDTVRLWVNISGSSDSALSIMQTATMALRRFGEAAGAL